LQDGAECGEAGAMSELTGRALELKRAGNRALAARDYGASERDFRLLIETAPDAVDGYLGLAKLFDRRHRQEETIRLLEPKVSRLDSPGILKALGDAYRVLGARGDREAIKKAIDYYDRYHRQRVDAVTLFYKGELLAELGELPRAFDALRLSLTI